MGLLLLPTFPCHSGSILMMSGCSPSPVHILSHYTTTPQCRTLLFAPFMHTTSQCCEDPPPPAFAYTDPLCTYTTAQMRPPFTLLTSPTQQHHHTGFALGCFLSRSHPSQCNHCATGSMFLLLVPIMGPVQLYLDINGVRILLFFLFTSPVRFHH